jgi:hypothetical protein
MTKSGSTVVFYLDGVAETAPAYHSEFDFTGPMAVGGRGGDFFNAFLGLVDEVAIYTRALSSTEIQSLKLGVRTRFLPLAPLPPSLTPSVVASGARAPTRAAPPFPAAVPLRHPFAGHP